MLGRTDSRRRLLFLLVTFAVIGAALFARLAYWQVTQRDRLADEAFAQTTMRTEALVYTAAAGVVVAAALVVRRANIAHAAVAGVLASAAFLAPLALNEAWERAEVGQSVRGARAGVTAISAGDAPADRVTEAAYTTISVPTAVISVANRTLRPSR